MDMVQHEIIGDDMQAVIISMGQGDVIRAEAGAMMYMTEGARWTPRWRVASSVGKDSSSPK